MHIDRASVCVIADADIGRPSIEQHLEPYGHVALSDPNLER